MNKENSIRTKCRLLYRDEIFAGEVSIYGNEIDKIEIRDRGKVDIYKDNRGLVVLFEDEVVKDVLVVYNFISNGCKGVVVIEKLSDDFYFILGKELIKDKDLMNYIIKEDGDKLSLFWNYKDGNILINMYDNKNKEIMSGLLYGDNSVLYAEGNVYGGLEIESYMWEYGMLKLKVDKSERDFLIKDLGEIVRNNKIAYRNNSSGKKEYMSLARFKKNFKMNVVSAKEFVWGIKGRK